MQLAGQNVKVTLDGQGADEELAGYHYFYGIYFKELLLKQSFKKLFSELYYYNKMHHSSFAFKTFFFFLLPQFLKSRVRVSEKNYLDRSFVAKYEEGNAVTNTIYASTSIEEALLDHFEYKLEHLLKWSDRNSMFFSVESRIPFLDYRIVERILSTSAEMKILNGETKVLLRRAMNGRLDEKIRTRIDKVGFETPEAEWFRAGNLRTMVEKMIISDKFNSRNLYNKDKVNRIYQNHLKGDNRHSKEIWKWIHLEKWYSTFID
jgi:asparagine synthase (glutamine-hydrolysing)